MERYQREVVAACNAVRGTSARNSFGTPTANENGVTFDRDRAIAGVRSTLAANRRRLKLLFDRPAPDSPRDEARIARQRFDAYARESRAFSSAVARTLPEDPTLEHIDETTAPFQSRSDAVITPLEDSMTQLAGQECTITTTADAPATARG